MIRLCVAQVFVMSGLCKASNWDVALNLARFAYPVNWLDPVAAAYSDAAIELVGGVLMGGGLLTRAAAVPLLLLSLVIPAVTTAGCSTTRGVRCRTDLADKSP